MEGYILFENGTKIEGTIHGKIKNSIGFVKSDANGTMLTCTKTGDCTVVIAAEESTLKSDTIFIPNDTNIIDRLTQNSTNSFGKLVSDDLSLDYHLYDLKTFIPHQHAN